MSNSTDSYVDGAVYRLADRRSDTPDDGSGDGTSPRDAVASSELLDFAAPPPSTAFDRVVATSPEFDAYRVAELKEALFTGRYRVDARAIAEKLLAMESKLP